MARMALIFEDKEDGTVEVLAAQDVTDEERAAPTNAMRMLSQVIDFLEVNDQMQVEERDADSKPPIILLN